MEKFILHGFIGIKKLLTNPQIKNPKSLYYIILDEEEIEEYQLKMGDVIKLEGIKK
jgi:hypothetical protein